jgi:hypothetical protein
MWRDVVGNRLRFRKYGALRCRRGGATPFTHQNIRSQRRKTCSGVDDGQKTPDLRAVSTFGQQCLKLAAGTVGSGDRQRLAQPITSIVRIAALEASNPKIREAGNSPESRRQRGLV